MLNMDKLTEWHGIISKLDVLKSRELELRKELFAAAFPTPTEGSKENKMPLSNGWILQGDHKINRTVDQAVVTTLMSDPETRDIVQPVFPAKYSLSAAKWKTLSDNELKMVADAVVEKPGTPMLKIVLPKRGA